MLGWYRKLIAGEYDGSKHPKYPGRPKISQEIIDPVIRFKKETPHWGYTRIRDYIVHLGYTVSTTTVENVLVENGYAPEPDLTRKTTWEEFLRSHWNVPAACDFFSTDWNTIITREFTRASIGLLSRRTRGTRVTSFALSAWEDC